MAKEQERLYGLASDLTAVDVMTAREVAGHYGLALITVRQAIRRGTLPARKSGGVWLIERREAAARFGLARKPGRRPKRDSEK